jgi:predicted Zn-dependent peptidase
MTAGELANVRRDRLPNGLVVITERMPHFRSVAVGIWVRRASRDEPPEFAGLAHFIEHMVFKGTERRSAEEIARAVDSVGGLLDAFTTKETVCFNARVLDEHLELAFDVLADLVRRPRFDPAEIEREKQVVLEEIKMDEDSPETLVNELFLQNLWREHPLGRPILGTRETVSSFDRDTLRRWFEHWYTPDNLVIVAAGNVEHDRFVEMVAREFSDLPAGRNGSAATPPQPQPALVLRRKRELEQVHLCLGVPACGATHPQRFAVALANTILGAGMSSRLFQNIRERQGLAYSVGSDHVAYRDAGVLSVYAGTSVQWLERLLQSVLEEFRRMKQEPVGEEELHRARQQLKGSYTLSLETPANRMANRARQELYFGRFLTLEEIFAAIDAVTPEQVQQAAEELFRADRLALAALGPLDGFQPTREILSC